ncbi:hypothetical protein JXO59_00010 [candidate division KSB1 bacterium]|nr:hypothetical protein [candidate division KSB1 bacterium]
MFRKILVLFFALTVVAIIFLYQSPFVRDHFAPPFFKMADCADDSQGEMALLLQKRDQAAIRGIRWMDDFLRDDEHFRTMPFEAYHFFFVCAGTSTHPEIAAMAGKMARQYEPRLKDLVLQMEEPLDRHVFLQLLELITKPDANASNDAALIAKAQRSFPENNDDTNIYGRELDHLDQEELIDIFYVLLHAYFLEKADVAYPGQFPVSYRLLDILRYLKTKPLENFTKDAADPSQAMQGVFLTTHIAYVMSDYSRLKLHEEDAPWLYEYLRKNFHGAMQSGVVDVVAEIVDVFRSLGYTEENSDIVRTGTEFLLERQNEDGSWGEVNVEEQSAYDNMHPTSSAIWALRDRSFLTGTPYSKRIQRILRELNENRASDQHQ